MLPKDEKVLKSSLGDDPLDTYTYQREFGYANQYARNCLQLNTGRGMKFADIALYSGVAATDWSWSPLVADFNLDGTVDIFVSNGIKKRPNDLDYIKFISSLPHDRPEKDLRIYDKEILKHLPPGDWHNYMFEGDSNFLFRDQSIEWGFGEVSLSQGAAYADLDGDGDLDIVTNNMNEPAGIYRNNTREKTAGAHYLSVELKGNPPNVFAVGAKVFVFSGQQILYKELQPVKGFMSSGELALNFGLGKAGKVDSMVIIWPDNRIQTIDHIVQDRKLLVVYSEKDTRAIGDYTSFVNGLLKTVDIPLFTEASTRLGAGFIHKEDNYFDFNDQWFIPHELSTQGPKAAVADVNKDGLEDFFACGAKGQAGAIFIQQKNGSFAPSADSVQFVKDKACEDVDAEFFDADGDGDQDLYVVSGGNIYSGKTPLLNDRLYLNDGKGHFSLSANLPAMYENKSVVRVADFDKDGDLTCLQVAIHLQEL
jgi:hypothetical protein